MAVRDYSFSILIYVRLSLEWTKFTINTHGDHRPIHNIRQAIRYMRLSLTSANDGGILAKRILYMHRINVRPKGGPGRKRQCTYSTIRAYISPHIFSRGPNIRQTIYIYNWHMFAQNSDTSLRETSNRKPTHRNPTPQIRILLTMMTIIMIHFLTLRFPTNISLSLYIYIYNMVGDLTRTIPDQESAGAILPHITNRTINANKSRN